MIEGVGRGLALATGFCKPLGGGSGSGPRRLLGLRKPIELRVLGATAVPEFLCLGLQVARPRQRRSRERLMAVGLLTRQFNVASECIAAPARFRRNLPFAFNDGRDTSDRLGGTAFCSAKACEMSRFGARALTDRLHGRLHLGEALLSNLETCRTVCKSPIQGLQSIRECFVLSETFLLTRSRTFPAPCSFLQCEAVTLGSRLQLDQPTPDLGTRSF
jgi:hypothetical protein